MKSERPLALDLLFDDVEKKEGPHGQLLFNSLSDKILQAFRDRFPCVVKGMTNYMIGFDYINFQRIRRSADFTGHVANNYFLKSKKGLGEEFRSKIEEIMKEHGNWDETSQLSVIPIMFQNIR